MTLKNAQVLWVCVAAFGVVASQAAAQEPAPGRINEFVRQAAANLAAGQGAGQAPNGPTTTRPVVTAAPGSTGVVRLTLDDVVKAALDHNINIAVSRLNPQIDDLAYANTWGTYKPVLTSVLSTQSTTTPSTNTIAGGTAAAPVSTGVSTFNGGVTQNVPWGGGNFNVQLNNNKTTSTSLINLYNPSFNPLWTAQYTQPLLQGFRMDTTRQQLRIAKINRELTDLDLRAMMTNILSNVREAYWNYVFAVQSVEVAQQALGLANQLVSDNQTRVQVGTMAPLDVLSAQSQAATAQQNLVVAQSSMRTGELSLKQLIVGGTTDPLWNATIDPVDRPDFTPEEVDVQAAVRRALSERTDLEIARKNLQSNDTTMRYLSDQLLPQANLVAQYGLTGVGGTQIQRTGTGIGGNGGTITNIIPGGYADALTSLWGTNFPRWAVSLNLGYPIGYSSQKASIAYARIQSSQAALQIKQIELQVATDVTNAAINVRSNIERVQAAQTARDLAQQALAAEQAKFSVGISTNYLVIQQQNVLATAQNNELQAVLNYRNSVVELDRLQQTTLQSAGITLVSNTAISIR